MNLSEIMEKFSISNRISQYGNGHINDTYLADSQDYILQRINTKIFTDPDALMENIENVTGFLKEKIALAGGDAERETLTVIRTKTGESYYRDGADCYRVYKFIRDTVTVEAAGSPDDMYRAGKGFGRFSAMLDDYPADTLNETVPDFHNTPKRLAAFDRAVSEDRAGRAGEVAQEIAFVRAQREIADLVLREIAAGKIPLRVTHNDTKINNILFDKETGEAVCVIDLDTVMQGSLLYDFGDALRIGASSAAEDESDLRKVSFDIAKYAAFAKGYIEETAAILTVREIELLPFAALLMTYECGVRFLTDYLNGDIYFKTHRERQNLDRARNQFKLVADIESKQDAMRAVIAELTQSMKGEGI